MSAVLPKAAGIPARLARTSLQCYTSASQGNNVQQQPTQSQARHFSSFSSSSRRVRHDIKNDSNIVSNSRVSVLVCFFFFFFFFRTSDEAGC